MRNVPVKSNNQLLRVIDKELHKWAERIYTLVFRRRCQNRNVPINRTVLAVSTDSMSLSVDSECDIQQCPSCKVNMLFEMWLKCWPLWTIRITSSFSLDMKAAGRRKADICTGIKWELTCLHDEISLQVPKRR